MYLRLRSSVPRVGSVILTSPALTGPVPVLAPCPRTHARHVAWPSRHVHPAAHRTSTRSRRQRCARPTQRRGPGTHVVSVPWLAHTGGRALIFTAGSGGVPVPATGFDESERLIWAGRAAAYAGSFFRLCAYPVSRLLDTADAGPGVRVLDVGTGPGTVAAAARARDATVTAVDAEPSMIVLARQAEPAADIRVAALPELPFGEGGSMLSSATRAEPRRPAQGRAGRVASCRAAEQVGRADDLGGTSRGRASPARPRYSSRGRGAASHLPPLAPEDDSRVMRAA
ncbi:MAG: class I SAM-dependent methyltransferase [Carbonactinosporaceae bacterium]